MNLHEYQAKALFAQYGIQVPNGQVIKDKKDIAAVSKKLAGKKLVAKVQIHAGGRGKAGGVKMVNSEAELTQFVEQFLGQKLVTYQSSEQGQPVTGILVEEVSDIAKELYLGALIDRASKQLVFIASTEGGMEIEKVAANTPEKILKIHINLLLGALPYQARELGFALGLNDKQVEQFSKLLLALYHLFMEKDLSLVEINPLVITKAGNLLCLDGKINIDENALFRQHELASWRDEGQEDAKEVEARKWDLNYIALDGDIGCMVNGAGLAMATMDIIKLYGGNPANFLDVGGGATKERVQEAFKIILADNKVKTVLVNIFGGIVRCDLIAEGIISAVSEVGIKIPVVVRLEGNHAHEAAQLLSNSKLNIKAATSWQQAAQLAVAAAKGAL